MSASGDLGIPIVALSGYDSQSNIDEVVADVERQGRPAVMIYVGDYDASGMHIPVKFRELTGWAEDRFIRIALTPGQIDEHIRPENESAIARGKDKDPRKKWFVENYGEENLRRWGIANVQVELDALEPEILHDLLEEAIERYLYRPAFDEVVARETAEREQLSGLADEWGYGDE